MSSTDVSEKVNFAKFEKLQLRGMHTIPSLLAGDIRSGVDTIVKNDFEPLGKREKNLNLHHFAKLLHY